MKTDNLIKSRGNKKIRILTDSIYALFLVWFGYILVNLFYNQSIRLNGNYNSDTNFYARTARVKDGTRMIAKIFHRLYNLSGDNWLIAIYMAVVVVATILVNYYLIKTLIQTYTSAPPRQVIQLASIAAIFSGSIYFPRIHPTFYRSSWSSYAWHSPTQQTMTLFALIAILAFIKIYENYLVKIKFSHWLILAISAGLATWSKPNFLFVMAPTVILLFLIELTKNKEYSLRYKFKRLVMFGLAYIPAGLYTISFYMQYFGESGSAGGGGIGFGFKKFVEGDNLRLIINIFFGLLFPIIVFIFNAKKFRDMRYKLSLTIFLISAAQALLFYEEGIRAKHGNFGWGKMMGSYYFFLCAIAFAIENFYDKNFMGGKKILRGLYFMILAIALGLHLVSQVYFFSVITTGHTYFF